jgi:predicted short-subunit dehydrogenase-like oxidoreductase (DUF2520 family)
MNSIRTIVFVGAGNVATHLIEAFHNTGREILQVYSRSELSAKSLAERNGISFTCNPELLNKDADLYIISVTDSALPGIAAMLNLGSKLVVHTSGTHSIDIINSISENTGVFYPLQTFTHDRPVNFLTIPLCIEANNEENLKLLQDLALSFTTDVRYIDSGQRKKIHLAAVFANNFTNSLYGVAEEILKSCDLPFDILKPLIKETSEKVLSMNPRDAQTGPARRNDIEVMEQHLAMLDNEEYRELYVLISEMIKKKF